MLVLIKEEILNQLVANIEKADESLQVAHDTCNDAYESLTQGQIVLDQAKKLCQQILNGESLSVPPELTNRGEITEAAYDYYRQEEEDE